MKTQYRKWLKMKSILFVLRLSVCNSFVVRSHFDPVRRFGSANGSPAVCDKPNKEKFLRHPRSVRLENVRAEYVDTITAATTAPSLALVQSLTETAIYECGNDAGLDALRKLAALCELRIPYDFGNHDNMHKNSIEGSNERLISYIPQLLPQSTREEFLNAVQRMESNEWLSQNPDSVDGLPSLHLNLVSNGEPLFPIEKNIGGQEPKEHEFRLGIQQLYNIVHPFVYNLLLPEAKKMLQKSAKSSATSLRVSDVFLRRYGQNICGRNRNGISAHYDVFSRVTAVVALDDVAADGRNGLFTTALEDESTGQTSNHKALRRFFPLHAGDGVLHTWDVLHGVDVEPGLNRTSLIVWFDDFPENEEEKEPVVSPWLVKHPDNHNDHSVNHILHFVLGSALSNTNVDGETAMCGMEKRIELFLRSASQRNSFALTRMGSLCEEGALTVNGQFLEEKAFDVLEDLRPIAKLPPVLQELCNNQTSSQGLAVRFWMEGAISGNPLAQKALADELMLESTQSGNEQLRILAAVLFSLAAQQGDQSASDSLCRVVELDVVSRGVETEEAFSNSPVVRVANAAVTTSF
ncbi:hypothetical protein IV203_019368 [Nitzschia inconspicua]|uniref:Fe2OG dioxygenase domain-containing protein n=1 Tax=Nitzschia inconspicua TaxID=303405 RepID=A0A9K3Q4F7_9STRA|nr:hypothetical protein IV203_019368 [Nitzschia inconspicua]